MATTTTKPDISGTAPYGGASVPVWPRGQSPNATGSNPGAAQHGPTTHSQLEQDAPVEKPSPRDALQALLAFSALHEQVRRRKALAARHVEFDRGAPVREFEKEEQFVLGEVLQLVAERAVAITGADGLAIALAENNEIVLRASAGTVRPDVGARIDRDSAFSGACFRQAEIFTCDDTETDLRVNVEACRRLGARSMIAVPLCGRRRVIGLIEAFFTWPFGFNDSDVRNLSLLAELVLGALKPEDEDRFAESAQVAVKKLEPPAASATKPEAVVPPVTAAPVAIPTKPATAAPAAPAAPAPRIGVTTPVGAPKPEIPKAAGEAKPAVASAASAPAPMVNVPAVKKAPESKQAVVAETAVVKESAAPELTFGQLEPEAGKRRPFVLVVLICIVVAAAIGGGVWYKWKTAQLGGAMVQTQNAAPKPADTAASATTPAGATAENPANATSEAIPEPNESVPSPAAPEDLAKFPRVSGIRHWSSADSSSVVLDLEDQVQYEAHRLANPDRIYFDLHDTQLAPELSGKSIDIGDALLNRVRIAQPVAGMTRVVLETRANTNFSVSLETNPYRLVVEVRKVGASPRGAVNLFPNAEAEKKLAIVIPPPSKEDLQLRTHLPKMRIVVDAGHGGWDLGTVGRRGLLEKDLVLEISQRLGKLLESRLGAEVIYTRQDDNYIPLDERAEMANQSQADLFVSVHANYSDLPSARGVETYYTNTFTAPGSKEAGTKDFDARANLGGTRPAMTPTLSPVELHDKVEQSRRLATSVQRSLYGMLAVRNPGLRDRGIKEAGFVVLTESAMPGILAEVSFVSSPTDEQKLRSDGYREQIAEALYRGIARYAAASKGVKVASAAK